MPWFSDEETGERYYVPRGDFEKFGAIALRRIEEARRKDDKATAAEAAKFEIPIPPSILAGVDAIEEFIKSDFPEYASLYEDKPQRPRCGAKTRAGTPCRCRGLENGRCKYHGGCSTGPRTPEGRARVAQAQRDRWARYRADKAAREALAKSSASS